MPADGFGPSLAMRSPALRPDSSIVRCERPDQPLASMIATPSVPLSNAMVGGTEGNAP